MWSKNSLQKLFSNLLLIAEAAFTTQFKMIANLIIIIQIGPKLHLHTSHWVTSNLKLILTVQ